MTTQRSGPPPTHHKRDVSWVAVVWVKLKGKKTKLEAILNIQASAKPRLRWEIHGAEEPCWSFGMLSGCIFFVPVPCLAEADAALMVVKYELISADLMLDPAPISIAKQGGWLLYSCCINSSLLRVAFKHISPVAWYTHMWKLNLEIHVSAGRARSEKHVDRRRSLLFLISHFASVDAFCAWTQLGADSCSKS